MNTAMSHLPLPPGLNVPDVRRPDDGANAVCIVQERSKPKKNWMTYHAAAAAAAALGSCWPTHPDSGFFAASGLGSQKVLRFLALSPSVAKYREIARLRRMAVAPEERFAEICAAAVAGAIGDSTRAALLLLLLGC